MQFFQQFGHLIFPKKCPFCGRNLPYGQTCCLACLVHLPKKDPVCESLPLKNRPLFFYAPFLYVGVVRKAVLAMKTAFVYDSAEFFAEKMLALIEDLPPFDGIAYVPAERKRHDALNHLTTCLAKALGCRVVFPLRKKKGVMKQHTLSKAARKRNVKRAYFCPAPLPENIKRLLLVDDVITTGATISACAEALYAAGATEVIALSAAYTPSGQTEAEKVQTNN